MKTASKIYTAIIMIFLFAPIAILLVFSFNEGKSLSVFSGFSLYWYKELFRDTDTLITVKNTLVLALSASAISTIMGTAAAVGIDRLKNRYLRAAMDTVTNIPMINPDIITGISLMLMFVFAGRLFGMSASLSFWSMLIAHVTFCLPYVILQVLPKLRQMDRSLPEAAMDLGCTPFKAFLKVEIPEILPGVVTGMIMAFTLSLDDFVISYFTAGNGFQTLPIRIYSMTKKTVTPKMYALATIIFFVILALLLVSNLADSDGEAKPRKAKRSSKRWQKVLFPVLAAALVCFVLIKSSARSRELVLNVYNWGEYISDGSEDSFDTVREFEQWYHETYGQRVKVNYDTYASNEDMYNRIAGGAVSYDVIIPSDYMVQRMANEGLLLPLDFENIPNYEYISDDFRGLYYDSENIYSIPYTYGVVGIIYNANTVDEADAVDWDLMWNEKYAGDILQFNNPRDAFGTAQYRLGLDVNDTAPALWDMAAAELKLQNPLVKSYVMDEIYNMLEAGEASIGAYYAGDYFTMLDAQAEDVDLRFYYPERTNYFIDAMCIPSCCGNKELAEIFINYMLSEEPAIANAEYIYYASPNALVYNSEVYKEDIGEEAVEILYPDNGSFKERYNEFAYRNLDQNALDYMTKLWEDLKIN